MSGVLYGLMGFQSDNIYCEDKGVSGGVYG